MLGPNGAGKTTLLRVVVGEILPDAGSIEQADGLRVVYFDQNRESLDPSLTLRRALSPEGKAQVAALARRASGRSAPAGGHPSIASDATALQQRLAEVNEAEAEVDRLYRRWSELEGKMSGNSGASAAVGRVMDRQMVRDTAGRVLRSDDLAVNEKKESADYLLANPAIGNPHMVRCAWCHQTRMLFRDEDKDSFVRTARGWRCTNCNEHAASQEVRF